ncbi:hypothetical protein [Holospora curviuscula]|uniref:Uncharacterized protein n=1 Tax=Holospora curviuscula TaxID=1082868 RepID=A0A2S5R9D0_9PROT|nr:hypothetical protein [Holospora curviuscula]PPE03931.1 hypothetical protein HCUR_00712 [Holospora curviuscula]
MNLNFPLFTLIMFILSPLARGMDPIKSSISEDAVITGYIQIRASQRVLTSQGPGSFSVSASVLGGKNAIGEFSFGSPIPKLATPASATMYFPVKRTVPTQVFLTNSVVPVEIVPANIAFRRLR